ncbi:MAG TPA: sigma-70 family RNA polymerase sigma factor [Burkholderiaceae bacterium]|nr:sigma-70 family RNA polymerase sigma factor [Burkholderiaceae bacterium]
MQAQAITAFEYEPRSRPQACASSQRPDSTRSRPHHADLESSRPALLRYARRALRNPADAEDVVQETLAAAFASPDAFDGRSSRMTWLMAILKHKIVDIYRRQAREAPLDDTPDTDGPDDGDVLFTPAGHWREPPANWGNPDAALAQRDFMHVLEGCIACLPERMARAFKMRELMELEVSEICTVLDVSSNHCFVMLHRARMRLRQLLEERWFALPAASRNC